MSDRLLVSTRKGLFDFTRNGVNWHLARKSFVGDNVSLTFPDARDGSLYAAMNLGHFGVKLKYSPDGGTTWEDRAVPAYPEGATIATADGKPPSPATMKQFWAIEACDAMHPGHLWAGTAPGGLFRTGDGGRTWDLVGGLWDHPGRAKWFGGGTEYPAVHSICVDPRDSQVVRVAVSCGGVWQTKDGGKTWDVCSHGMFADFMPPELKTDPGIQDPHRMVQSIGDPDSFWVQHHNGVFRSTNGGTQWDEVPKAAPSVFGFGVAVHPRDGKTAWFVPAVKDECRVPVDGMLVVSRTRDGGNTFEVLRNGLPQQAAFDLVFRHALDVDATGNCLAIGSTTGGLWASDNQGDSWQTVSTHLPPIHAVRFA